MTNNKWHTIYDAIRFPPPAFDEYGLCEACGLDEYECECDHDDPFLMADMDED